MIAFARRDITFFIWNHTSPAVCRSPVSFSPYLHFFSTSRESNLFNIPAAIDVLVHKHEFPPELASRVASVVTRLRKPENGVSVLSFFKDIGFSDTQLEKIMEDGSRVISCSLEDSIKPKMKILQDLGIPSGDICKIISSNPSILRLSVENNIIPSVSVLKGLLGSNNEVAKVIRRQPRFLKANFQRTVLPNVEILKSCGIPMERIRIIFTSNPACFMLKPEVMRKAAEKAKEMGLDTNSLTFLYAIPPIAKMSNEAWDLRLQGLRSLGFSDSDISTMFGKAPQVFGFSVEKIKKSTELLLGTRKFNICSIVNYPKSLASSIENRLIPRFRILEVLESKNLIKEWPSLSAVSMLPDDQFFKKFIGPYSNELSGLCIKKSSARGKKGD